jgi:hypothetical protein
MSNRLYKSLQNFADQPGSLLQVTLIGWIATKCLTIRLWGGDRAFPIVPVWEGLRTVPNSFHLMLLVMALMNMSKLAYRPGRKGLIVFVLIVEILSCLLDQNRLQPWEYQFIFLLFIYLSVKPEFVRTLYLMLLAGLYTYSGLHKLNPDFIQVVWKDMICHRYLQLDPSTSGRWMVQMAGYSIPVIELGAGLCLLAGERIRQQSLSVLIVMHLIILIILGPIGIRHNVSVWPWNGVMMASLLILKFGTEKPSVSALKLSIPVYIVWAFWILLPAFSFIGLWDQYLSGNLYSGKLPRQSICIGDSSQARPMRQFFGTKPAEIGCAGKAAISVQQWALRETGVPPYPEKRVSRAIDKWWKKQFPASDGQLIYYRKTKEEGRKQIIFTP